MIAIKNLVKSYGATRALDHLSLDIGRGVIFGLLGPNGAGKTTLISILNGLTTFDDGAVEIFGLDLRRNLKSIRRRSAFIPERLALYENLTVYENLTFFAGIQAGSKSTQRKNIDYAVGVNRLDGLLSQKAGTLSGGQKRRLNIALGLLNAPDILYFDEPTVGVDLESRNGIIETIKSFKQANKTVIYTSHYMPEIEKICDEAAIIDQGKIIQQGTLASMLQETNSHRVVIALHEAAGATLKMLCAQIEGMEIVDATSLLLENPDARKMGALLKLLEDNRLQIKQIRYGTTNLENLFLRLTTGGKSHD
ncbi:MAG: ABC transporter ATP-binding protein [Desulfobacterales bacterium]|nr:ABC transporter ATP-binding protein [Desulfobacterales bacterium]